jgi:hypothetical protein
MRTAAARAVGFLAAALLPVIAAAQSALPAALPPLPPPYLATIKFIDDGMRYIDPLSGFFVSPAGELCFRQLPETVPSVYAMYYKSWCMWPQAVGTVTSQWNDNTRVDEVRLSCRHAAPQCAHRLEPSGFLDESAWVANNVTIQTAASRDERNALTGLIARMTGYFIPGDLPMPLTSADPAGRQVRGPNRFE